MRLTSLICTLLLVLCGCEQRPSDGGTPGPGGFDAAGPTVLVTGSNRGIGFEFARQYAEAGWRVIATARKPESSDELQALAEKHADVHVERLDVTDDEQIAALAAKYEGQPIDVLINNAGVRGSLSEQALGSFSREGFDQIMGVNVYGPLKVSEAFVENVAASKQKKIVVITSRAGSLTKAKGRKGLFFYQISKAGINMGMIAMHGHLRNRGIKIGIYSPGQVDTRMWRMDGNTRPATPPEKAVEMVRQRIAELTPKNSATFLQNDGTPIPW